MFRPGIYHVYTANGHQTEQHFVQSQAPVVEYRFQQRSEKRAGGQHSHRHGNIGRFYRRKEKYPVQTYHATGKKQQHEVFPSDGKRYAFVSHIDTESYERQSRAVYHQRRGGSVYIFAQYTGKTEYKYQEMQ